MKTFEEILEEVKNEQDWVIACLYGTMTGIYESVLGVAVKRYAKQIAQDALNRAAESAVVNQEIFKDKSIITVYKPSIANTEIILP